MQLKSLGPEQGSKSLWWVVLVGSVLVGLGRFGVPGHGLSWAGSYEAFAHIWVGFLVCLAVMKWSPVRVLCGVALAVITIVETILFLTRNG